MLWAGSAVMSSTVEGDAAGAGARAAEDAHHQRGLAGAVGPDQRHDLARAHLDADAMQHRELAVAGSDLLDAEARRGHSATSRSTSGIFSSGTPR